MHIDDKTATESRSCSVAGERERGGNETPDRVPPAARHPAENTWRHTERAVLVQERSSEWRVVPEFKPSTLHSSLLLFYGNSQGNQRFCFTPKLWRRTIVDHLHASELKYKYDLILFNHVHTLKLQHFINVSGSIFLRHQPENGISSNGHLNPRNALI